MSSPLFVSGASGQLGGAVVRSLLAQGHQVIAGTRNPDGLSDLAAAGAVVRRIDFTDPSSVGPAVAGAERALFVSTDAVGNRKDAQIAAVRAAGAAGVRHLVYTSVASADVPGMTLGDEHAPTEAAIREHLPGYTILRNNLYAEILVGSIGHAIASGQLVTARGDGRVAWVSRDDCAAAAAAALADGFDGTRVIDIAGPASLTGDETAAVMSELSGTPIAHVSVPPDALQQGLASAGVPGPMAQLLVHFDTSVSRGLLDASGSALQELTGRPGRSLRDVLEAAREAWAA